MGKQSIKIAGLDVKDLIKDLNKAYADEWLAYYSWWYMSQTVTGPGYEDMSEFLEKIAKDELEHPEAHLPKPKYMIVMEVEEIVDLTPGHIK